MTVLSAPLAQPSREEKKNAASFAERHCDAGHHTHFPQPPYPPFETQLEVKPSISPLSHPSPLPSATQSFLPTTKRSLPQSRVIENPQCPPAQTTSAIALFTHTPTPPTQCRTAVRPARLAPNRRSPLRCAALHSPARSKHAPIGRGGAAASASGRARKVKRARAGGVRMRETGCRWMGESDETRGDVVGGR